MYTRPPDGGSPRAIMEQKTSLASGIEVTQAKEKYDAACKRLLSEKIILAHILKSCVAEFRDYDAAFIAENCIEGHPYVSGVPVAPDETGAMLRGMNTAQTSPTEGDAYFDIYFNAVVPGTGEVVQLIVNVEAQADFYPGYPLPKRGIYYCSRMISAQNGTVFENAEYDKLRKVCSIWVCTNPPKKRENTITYYNMAEHNLVGDNHEAVEDYDLLSLVLLYLGTETGENYHGVLKLLGTLLTSDATVDEKKQILQDEFHIPMTQTMEKEVSFMGRSLYEAAVERRVNKGYAQGIEQGILLSAQRLVKNAGWPFEKAMSTLEVPQEQWKSYSEQLKENRV